MTHATILRPSLGPVEPHILYPMADLQARTGMGITAMRSARRGGLVVKYVGGRAYVLGRDFIEYVQERGKDSK